MINQKIFVRTGPNGHPAARGLYLQQHHRSLLHLMNCLCPVHKKQLECDLKVCSHAFTNPTHPWRDN